MRLNVNVGGIPTPGPQMPNIKGSDVAKVAKSSLVFGIISTILSLVAVFSRVSFYIVRGLIRDVTEVVGGVAETVTTLDLWGSAVQISDKFTYYFNIASILSAVLLIVITTVLGIVGIALYPKAASGRIANTADRVGLILSIVSLVLAAVALILCFPIVIAV